jgi:hypothetical protein
MNQSETQQLARGLGAGLEKALFSYQEVLHQDLARNRFAEEREWYEEGLFYQRRQWLKWDNSNKRWSVVKQDPDKPRPMPVTNHFARTINANANQLGSGKERVVVIPNDDSDKNRRGAEFAEKAIDAIDEESGFNVQRPLLAKQTSLWGIGVAVDTWDPSSNNGVVKIPQIEVQSTPKLGCIDCGQVADLSPEQSMNPGATMPGQQQAPCPYCGGSNTMGWQEDTPVTTEVKEFSNGRICTEVRPIFEFFIPRDCQGNPNLAKKLQQKYRLPVSRAKQLWPDHKEDLKPDEKQETNEIYLEALRSLVNYNYMHDQTGENLTIVVSWVDWDQLPDELQEKLEEAVQTQQMNPGDPDQDAGDDAGADAEMDAAAATGMAEAEPDEDDTFEAPDGDLDPLEQLHQWGIFIVAGGGKTLDWGINNCEGKKAPTFFLWEVDPANVYPKGLGSDLIPLQKRLNRIDSLIELAMMSNAAGKWLWPTTQTTNPPNGSPSDVVEFDPIGDGKIAPTFVQPSPFHASVWQLRQAIKQDFLEIGMTEGVNQGQNPSGVDSFRGLAYLGAKAQEQISTQRSLWEMGLKLRHEKTLILARRYWSQGRKVKVAGYNGKWGMTQVMGEDLAGDYSVSIVENSSRPKSIEEREQTFALLLQSGMVDAADPSTREYIVDQSNLNNINLVDHLQYMKAERDLDQLLAGNPPMPNPAVKPQIALQVLTNYMLTEEFDQQQPEIQQQLVSVYQTLEQAIAMQQAGEGEGRGAAPANPGQKLGAALTGKKQENPGLNGVPGKTTSPEASAAAAEQEGAGVAAQLP